VRCRPRLTDGQQPRQPLLAVCRTTRWRIGAASPVEGVGRDLCDVDVVQRPQIAGDDPAVLLERVGRPASFLHGHPLLGEVAEGPARMRRFLLEQLDFPRARLALGFALPRGVDGRGGPRPGAREWVSARVDPELPATGRELSNARHRSAKVRGDANGWHGGWHGGWHAGERRRPRLFGRGLCPARSAGTPNGIRTRVATTNCSLPPCAQECNEHRSASYRCARSECP
jgi:hypothetical protein